MPTTIRDLFDLPVSVQMTDFVHQIDGGDDEARKRRTLEQYQVTPSIEKRFDSALEKLQDGLRDRKSVFSWVHGSFGSGKSHFMNVLSLLLADDALVFKVHPELQAHRQKYFPGAIGRKLFRLHVQCISRQARTLEELIFGPATEELARRHPDRPAPALYETTKVFESARAMLEALGDEKFFAEFPSNRAGDDDDWGEIATGWDRVRFERGVASPASAEGRALVGELARTSWLAPVIGQSEFVKLGDGLRALAEHLKLVGYEGIVLFLDELILWLTTMQEDKARLAAETAKVAALLEHGEHPPVLPIFTFAARQRDLSQMVGSFAVGKDEEIFRDYLKYWDSRFEVIPLEDKDLARIIERRLLKPRSDTAKAQVDQAFAEYRERYARDFRELFGDQGDADDFRRVYPFSPALVHTTVALSATLQRDRTALRELTNLLVHYLPDFELGNVVPVGDLFDVIVQGKVSDLGTIQQVYEQARKVYEGELLPAIRKKNGTDSPEKCQLLVDGADAKRGCAGCPQKACRTQTRIAKTVLLQGIAPNASALKNLTASRIVALNSGTLKSKIPNQEAALAATMLRDWAAITGAIQVRGDANPQVSAALDSIDSRRILDANRAFDNVQRRRQRVRQVLFEKFGITDSKAGYVRELKWCSRDWNIGVVYENVRSATDPTFRPGTDEDLRLIIDFPFDDAGHGPAEDEARLDSIISAGAQRTVVWLPAFLSDELQSTLGDLVILDGLVELKEDDFANRVQWVSSEDLARAREVLRQQRGLKQAQVENALASAYGVTNQYDDKLAPGLRPERHAHLLVADAPLTVPLEGDLGRCLEGLLKQALQKLAPRHPNFLEPPTKSRLENVLETLGELVQTAGQRLTLDPKRLKDVRGIAAAEHFSLVRVVESEAIFSGGILHEMEKRLAARGSTTLSVGDVRASIDPNDLMSLSPELEDFLVLAYARCSSKPYRFTLHGQPTEPGIGQLQNELALMPVSLPSVADWERALTHAGVFGITLTSKVVSASRVEEISKRLHERTKALETGLSALDRSLVQCATLLGAGDFESSLRASAVRSLLKFVRAVPGKSPFDTVVQLASTDWPAARITALAHVANAERVGSLVGALTNENSLGLLRLGVTQAAQGQADAKAALDKLRKALAADENITALAAAIDDATKVIVKLMAAAAPPPPPPPITVAATPPVAGFVAPIAPPSPPGGSAPPAGLAPSATFVPRVVRSSADLVQATRELEKLVSEGKTFTLHVTFGKPGGDA